MLRYLSVRHLAVIDGLDIEFEPGLNVLTGETGAGKSVLVEAIDLLMGGRASADLVRTGESQATVQAIFEASDGREVIVRREISAQGRSRAFIDDALATTAALRDLGATLLDLHGQHEHRALADPAEHLALLDAFGSHGAMLDATAVAWDAWRAAVEALDRTRLDDREKQARIDMATFHLDEIDRVAPRPGEDAALAAERTVLANADRIQRLAGDAHRALYDGEHAALTALGLAWKRVDELAAVDARFAAHAAERDDIKARLEDLAFTLGRYLTDLEASPERLQAVEDRLAGIERLKRKHGATIEDVLARRDALEHELEELGASGERAAALAARERAAAEAYLAAAAPLSAARERTAARLSRALANELEELAMPACRLDVRVATAAGPTEWTRAGTESVEFRFSPNPGEDLRPLARIASGGELSRVMLALRLLAQGDAAGRTVIFDEVDAGIGGAAADAVGARLQALGSTCQVLSVTHLPQIAARADAHFRIAKHVRRGRTHTEVARLDGPAREAEVGRMIAGASVSERVLASARDLLAVRARGEDNAKHRHASTSKGRRRGA